jgi:phosphoribosylanthranilate isomerase
MNLKLKICGLRESENIQEVSVLSPDYMGFIFYKNSPRYVPDDFVMPDISNSIQKLGVFVNEVPDRILQLVKKHRFNFVQLHGDEVIEDCEVLKQNEIKVIKAFSIHNQFDFKLLDRYQAVVDYLLFDTKGKYYGGNAQPFDWAMLRKYNQKIPFFLSGGLTKYNIQYVRDILDMNIHALDLNSGVELSPGLKSVTKIRDIQILLNSQLLDSNF